MKSELKLNQNRLHIFHEGRKRRIFVGELIYLEDINQYELIYDKNYLVLKNAIPLSPDLDLFKHRHISEKGKLFPTFIDRIPLKSNPAYKDYCLSQHISIHEQNPIILLGTIGKRGPSSFIFEPVYENEFAAADIIKTREEIGISQNDLAKAFNLSKETLQKIENGLSKDLNTLKLIEIYFKFPNVGMWQLKQSGNKVHSSALFKLTNYFYNKKVI